MPCMGQAARCSMCSTLHTTACGLFALTPSLVDTDAWPTQDLIWLIWDSEMTDANLIFLFECLGFLTYCQPSFCGIIVLWIYILRPTCLLWIICFKNFRKFKYIETSRFYTITWIHMKILNPWITDTTPEQLCIPVAPWPAAAVRKTGACAAIGL